jgi:hypothetical protein
MYIELLEIPGYRGLNSMMHPYQPIKTGFTRSKPLSPDKNCFSRFSWHIKDNGRKKRVKRGKTWVKTMRP